MDFRRGKPALPFWRLGHFLADVFGILLFGVDKDKLELGKAIHLNMQSDGVIEANIIGISLNFEKPTDFSLTFSNRYRLKNGAESLADTIQKAGSTTRSFDANKYLYNQAANKTTQVSQFMNGQLNAAVNTILGASNQSVVINGAGIQVGGDSNYQMRIVDNMIAMTDDSWKTAKLALGLFATEETGTQWGVNAEMLAGKLIIGNNMILENATDDGVMQFKVDATGAWLNNATFVLQNDAGGRMILDPKYGIMAGTKLLFDTEGTTVKPSFVDEDDALILDDDGMPKNTNFFLDIRDGNAYFRGKVKATSGAIGGLTLQDDYLYGGSGQTFVALNGSGSNDYSIYAIWAGAENPNSAPFRVKKDGSLYANNATISGTLNAPTLKGNLTADDGWLIGCGINVNDGAFYVDQSGDVTMSGNIVLAGNITWNTSNSPCQAVYARLAYPTPSGAYNSFPATNSNGWHRTLDSNDYYVSYTYDGGGTWTSAIKIRGEDGADGSNANVPKYITETCIDGATIRSPVIEATEFNIYPSDSTSTSGSYNIYGNYGDKQYHMFAIEYYQSEVPFVNLYSPDKAIINFGLSDSSINMGGSIRFGGASLNFSGATVDFNGATVKGLLDSGTTLPASGTEGQVFLLFPGGE